ncbi:hypothetical protein QQX98_010292 [Neonectria punicea]|uniref:Uncharacterized protein n=1 Tax=Neonectria punicea TaxID=979145 RepID=A0ABR1GQ72_9HYPO
MSELRIQGFVRAALNGNETAIQGVMDPLRETVSVFDYLNEDDVVTRMDTIASGIYQDLQLIELYAAGSEGLSAHWNEFYPQYFGMVSEFARDFVSTQVRYIQLQFAAHDSPYRESVLKELSEIQDRIKDMKYPFED